MKVLHQVPLALITGAAKRVGRLTALHLAGKGYAIALHYNSSREDAQTAAEEIRRLGVPAYPLQADLSDEQAVHTLFQQLDDIPHQPKVLVNSAAVMARSDLLQVAVEDWDGLMNLNARAVWLTSREVSKRMKEGGTIINISDVGARKNWTGYGAYVVSKAAVETITRLMAKQLAPAIRVNAIAPGLLMRGVDLSDVEWQALIEKVPMRKVGEIGQFLDTLDFLLSNEYITGEVISLSGGIQLV